MGLKDMIENRREKKKERKELMRKMDEQMRVEELLQERKKSSNERELDRFFKEDREEQIKLQLNEMRKKRDADIKFGHNPLNTKNIMKAEWEVLREPNLFTGKSNIFSKHESVLKNNPKLLKNNMRLMK
jgi:hypothetical protein